MSRINPNERYMEISLPTLASALIENGTARERVMGEILKQISENQGVFGTKSEIARKANASTKIVNDIINSLLNRKLVEKSVAYTYHAHPGMWVTPLIDDKKAYKTETFSEIHYEHKNEKTE